MLAPVRLSVNRIRQRKKESVAGEPGNDYLEMVDSKEIITYI